MNRKKKKKNIYIYIYIYVAIGFMVVAVYANKVGPSFVP